MSLTHQLQALHFLENCARLAMPSIPPLLTDPLRFQVDIDLQNTGVLDTILENLSVHSF